MSKQSDETKTNDNEITNYKMIAKLESWIKNAKEPQTILPPVENNCTLNN